MEKTEISVFLDQNCGEFSGNFSIFHSCGKYRNETGKDRSKNMEKGGLFLLVLCIKHPYLGRMIMYCTPKS